MPEVVMLQCDAPGCLEVGPGVELIVITIGGEPPVEVLACQRHRKPIVEATRWGRPARGSRRRKPERRGTAERDMVDLLPPDVRPDR